MSSQFKIWWGERTILPTLPEPRVEPVTLRIIDYSPEKLEEREISSVDEAIVPLDGPNVTWLDIVGVGDVGVLRRLGEHLAIHSLVLEDIHHTGQRPKLEEHERYVFATMRSVRFDERLHAAQVSLLFGPGWVVTTQEAGGDCFEPVRERLRRGRGRIRGSGSDYLAYALIDALVDHLFPVLETYGERLEDLETKVAEEPSRDTVESIHRVKRDLLLLRQTAWPQREVVQDLERSESPLIAGETRLFLRDCYDHAVQIMDVVEIYRDVAGDLMDLYLSSASNRTNEIMRVLTVVASVFIPLTFLAGIYGMNFDPAAGAWNMPELGWRYGYLSFWGLILLVGGGLLWFFRRRGWL